MKLYYGEIIAGRSQPPEFQSMMKGCIGYVTKSGEKIYYDRGTVLRQLGVFHEPQSILGRLSVLVTHPATIARTIARTLKRMTQF